jgi:hypothetical protein
MSANGLVGYLSGTSGNSYAVYDTATHVTTVYEADASLQVPAISWDGTRVAFRTFGGASTGIAIGVLSN